MEDHSKDRPEAAKTSEKTSPVKTVLSWLIEADREFRIAQTMVNERHYKMRASAKGREQVKLATYARDFTSNRGFFQNFLREL